MGTDGLKIYRYNGRYYVYYSSTDSNPEEFGKILVRKIPTDPEEYKEWLKRKRRKFAEKEHLDDEDSVQDFFEIERDAKDRRMRMYSHGLCEAPSALIDSERTSVLEHVYIINLDREVLTMDYGVHYKMDNLPRENDIWYRAISKSIYTNMNTVNASICPEEHMGCPAVQLPQPVPKIEGYAYKKVAAKTGLDNCGSVFVMRVLAEIFKQYESKLLHYAREWESTDFPFRELTYAVVSLAANQGRFRRFPPSVCTSRFCSAAQFDSLFYGCNGRHVDKLEQGWLGEDNPLTSDLGACSRLGYPFHRPGQPAGAAPVFDRNKDELDTMYWLKENVLVFPTLVPDGAAISKAVTKGLADKKMDKWTKKHCHCHFHVVAISLFEVALADVSFSVADGTESIFVRVTDPLRLSPIRPEFCFSNHPLERPARQETMPPDENRSDDDCGIVREGESDLRDKNCTGSKRRLSTYFPGLAALVYFLDVAAARRAMVYTKKKATLPQEMYDRIAHFVDAASWRTCLETSQELRVAALVGFKSRRRYRIDDTTDIVDGPWLRIHEDDSITRKEVIPVLSFDVVERHAKDENMPVPQCVMELLRRSKVDMAWTPFVGAGERVVIMPQVLVNFGAATEEAYPDSLDAFIMESNPAHFFVKTR